MLETLLKIKRCRTSECQGLTSQSPILNFLRRCKTKIKWNQSRKKLEQNYSKETNKLTFNNSAFLSIRWEPSEQSKMILKTCLYQLKPPKFQTTLLIPLMRSHYLPWKPTNKFHRTFFNKKKLPNNKYKKNSKNTTTKNSKTTNKTLKLLKKAVISKKNSKTSKLSMHASQASIFPQPKSRKYKTPLDLKS